MISILNISLFSSAAPNKKSKRTPATTEVTTRQMFRHELQSSFKLVSDPALKETRDNILDALSDGDHEKFKTAFQTLNNSKQDPDTVYDQI